MGVVSRIKEIITSKNDNLTVFLKENKGIEDSIIVKAMDSPFYGKSQEHLLANIKTSGKKHYLSLNSRYMARVKELGLTYSQIESQPNSIRIPLVSLELLEDETLELLVLELFRDLFSSDGFGCCHLYLECSNAKECLHVDKLYARACQYRRSLESNRIFYGQNRNIFR